METKSSEIYREFCKSRNKVKSLTTQISSQDEREGNAKLLHDVCNALSTLITIIFNTSLKEKTIPQDWKEGCITAIYKKGNRKQASNYRPHLYCPPQTTDWKLKSYGIAEEKISWVTSLASGRKQRDKYVSLNSSFSEFKQVTSGIPHSSVLGPILFVIYINDLQETLDSYCYMFADDTKVFRPIPTTDDNDALHTDLSHLETW
ncbi:unnamed protein product [Mytilus edulis]|uniref:Reverse transcriptase domain-containing protein n=1 Tax=Mytilus edulis TaxID=6550 RepID=A0A8S3TQ24_MYTED|nr:unnamed protein product [Mytilus edulis]